MWQQLITYLEEFRPETLKVLFITVFGFLSGVINSVMGEHVNFFYWLLGFAVADWVTGFIAAARSKTLSSRTGFKGAIRKALMLFVAACFHGLDQILGMPQIGAWAISMFCINELISIIENIEKAGFGSVIPTKIRDALEVVQKEHENKIKNKLGAGQ